MKLRRHISCLIGIGLNNFLIRLVLLILAVKIPENSCAFELLPYIYVDYHFYIKLAQCQSKCARQHGQHIHRVALNGDLRIHFDETSESLYSACKLGCNSGHARKVNSADPESEIRTDLSSMEASFVDGQIFWSQTQHLIRKKHRGEKGSKHNSTTSSPIQAVRVLCVQKSDEHTGASLRPEKSPSLVFFPTLEATIAIHLFKDRRDETASFKRYVIQWKQRSVQPVDFDSQNDSQNDETNWITSSIEASNIFEVKGIQPDLAYRFSVTAVSEDGKLGRPVQSEWMLFSDYSRSVSDFYGTTHLEFYSRYDLQNNLGVLIQWRQNQEKNGENFTMGNTSAGEKFSVDRVRRELRHFSPLKSLANYDNVAVVGETLTSIGNASRNSSHLDPQSTGLSQLPILPFCCLQLKMSNETLKTVKEYKIDDSDGILIGNLGFNSEYSVEIRQCQTSYVGSNHENMMNGTFTSMHCWKIYGMGSLECDPEPVKDLQVVVDAENSNAEVSWLPSDSGNEIMQNTLLYEITYHPLSNLSECSSHLLTTRIIRPPSRSAIISLPQAPLQRVCEFEVNVTNYDLLGKQASASIRFALPPFKDLQWANRNDSSAESDVINRFLNSVNSEPTFLALLAVIIFIPLAAIFTLICTLRQTNRKQKPYHAVTNSGHENNCKRVWKLFKGGKNSATASPVVSQTSGTSHTLSPTTSNTTTSRKTVDAIFRNSPTNHDDIFFA